MPPCDLFDPSLYSMCWHYLSTALLPDTQQQTISPGSFRQVLRPVNYGKAKTIKTTYKAQASSMLRSIFYLLLEISLKHLSHASPLDSSYVLLSYVTFPVVPLPSL